jgi:carbamoyltransferase
VFAEHHESHAASAFFPSPFEEAAILTLDGVGEWATAGYGMGRENRIELTHELHFPHSLGLLYSAFTYFCGFRVNSDEYKLMGLAPYGEPRYAEMILDKLVSLKEDGSIWMDMSYFNYCRGLTMTSRKFEGLFDGPPRRPESPITRREMDMAASIQRVTEEVMLTMARHVHAETGMSRLCLAGGVALNCVANGRLLREGPFDDIWIQPAAGDAGGALGVALFIWHQLLGNSRDTEETDSQRGSLLGVSYGDDQIAAFLQTTNANYELTADDDLLCDRVADEIEKGRVVAWFQDRMEFGPRALGCRSILADARKAEMQSLINTKIKFREGFRPFAPAVLREHAEDYFEMQACRESPYMLLAGPVHQGGRSPIPAATHVDCSARVQTVDPERHGLFHKLLDTFYRKTGCPVVVNTSFNLSWEPIVGRPLDAYRTFMTSGIDTLCMGHYVLVKSAQPAYASGSGTKERDEVLADLLCDPEHSDPEYADGVAEEVKAFYEKNPFPNYDDHDTVRSLIDKARRSGLPLALDHAIPYNSTVLEVGCGTGQLTNFLGVSCRRVVGTDTCENSLRLAEQFRQKHGLDRVRFVPMDVFRPCLEPERFDVILCLGVLHHTRDAFAGFRLLLPLLKPGGRIVIGLYNRWGRLPTDLRRQFFRVSGGRLKWIDPVLRGGSLSAEQRHAWFADQYCHPHESKHTVGEVLRWFDRTGVEFVRCVFPGASVAVHDLFQSQSRPARADRFFMQAREMVAGGGEGGLFLMIGRKPVVTAPSESGAHGVEESQRIHGPAQR